MTRNIILLFTILLSSCQPQNNSSVEDLILSYPDMSPKDWEGWIISWHPDNFYWWVEITYERVKYPRLFYTPGKQPMIKYRSEDVYVAEDSSELLISDKWSKAYPFLPADVLLKRLDWIENHKIESLIGESDMVRIETSHFKIERSKVDKDLRWIIIDVRP